METVEEARAKIVREITSDDADVRSEYLTHFRNEVEQFAQPTAEAIVSWRSLDSGVKDDTRRAYVSAIVLTAITLNVNAMKLFISGQQARAAPREPRHDPAVRCADPNRGRGEVSPRFTARPFEGAGEEATRRDTPRGVISKTSDDRVSTPEFPSDALGRCWSASSLRMGRTVTKGA